VNVWRITAGAKQAFVVKKYINVYFILENELCFGKIKLLKLHFGPSTH